MCAFRHAVQGQGGGLEMKTKRSFSLQAQTGGGRHALGAAALGAGACAIAAAHGARRTSVLEVGATAQKRHRERTLTTQQRLGDSPTGALGLHALRATGRVAARGAAGAVGGRAHALFNGEAIRKHGVVAVQLEAAARAVDLLVDGLGAVGVTGAERDGANGRRCGKRSEPRVPASLAQQATLPHRC